LQSGQGGSNIPSVTKQACQRVGHLPPLDSMVGEQTNKVCPALVTGYGAYPPITWPEVLVWIFCMICVATMFAFFNGQ